MKLQYLKSSLRGDALHIIQLISILDANYEIGWSLLEEHNSIKQKHVYAHLKRFMSIQSIQHENQSAVLSLIDIASESLRLFEILGQKVDDLLLFCVTF